MRRPRCARIRRSAAPTWEAEPLKRFGVGLDFGTSNSAVAWFDGEQLHRVQLERDSSILPTAIHLDRGFSALTGSAAIDRYVEENRGRRVELVAEVIGESASSVTGNNTGEDITRLETQRNTVYGPLYDRTLPGRLFPAHSTSLGKAMLAGLEDSEVRRLLGKRPLKRFTAKTVETVEALLQDLRVARRRGYATVDEEMALGLGSVGAAVRNHTGAIVAAVSVTAPPARLRVDVIAERVTQAFKIILTNKKVKAILVNIFGGIVRCDTIAQGVITAVKEVHVGVPVVVRLEGTNVEKGREMLAASGLKVVAATGLTDAASKVVKLAGAA